MAEELVLTKRFDTGDLADGATFEKELPVHEHYTLHRIYIQALDGYELNKSLFHLEVGPKNYFADDLPAAILGKRDDMNRPLNIDVPAESVIRMVFKNLEGATKRCYITLWFTKP